MLDDYDQLCESIEFAYPSSIRKELKSNMKEKWVYLHH